MLARGSKLHGANGIRFDSADRLHIAALANDTVTVMDRESGEILYQYGPEVGVVAPDDIAFGPDGSLYWTSFLTGEVVRLTPQGVRTSQMVGLGVNGIAFSPQGRLFVSLDMLGDALFELDPELANPPRLVAEGLGFLNAMDWGPDGFLYGPLMIPGLIVRVDPETGAVFPVASGFTAPVVARFDQQNRLYVADYLTGLVSRVDISSGATTVITALQPGIDSLAFDSQGRLFASGGPDGYIVEIRAAGNRTVSRGGMIYAGGLALVPSGSGYRLYEADLFSLRSYDPVTGNQRSVERTLLGFTPLTMPMTVAADGQNVLISSWFLNQVQIWDPAAHAVIESYDDFALPMNAIRFQGDLLVAELGTGSVVRANATGRVPIAQGLGIPIGLAATADAVWVSDWAAGMVFQIVAGGQPLPAPIPVATGLANPEGLAVGGNGSLLVVEEGAKRLSRIRLATGQVTTVADGLQIGLPTGQGGAPPAIFNGVEATTIGPLEVAYVAGDVTNVIYRVITLH